MIDLALLRSDPDRVRDSQRARGDDPAVVDAVTYADAKWRVATHEAEAARAKQKSLGKSGTVEDILENVMYFLAKWQEVSKGGKSPESERFIKDKEDRIEQLRSLADVVKGLTAEADRWLAERDRLMMTIGNIAEPGVPSGGADDFAVLRQEGAPRDFAAEGIEIKDHLAIGEGLKAIDMERGAKVSGARFYFLTGVGAQLELAILNAAMTLATSQGFSPMITPTLVRPETMRGTGFLGSHSDEIYYLEKDDLYLVGTSEVALAGYHSDEILDLADGPLRYAGWSACFRREAGSAGRDTRGIIRVHQFHKVEMFAYTRP